MREIIFRIWDKQKKKWADSSVVQYAGLGAIGWVREPTDRYIINQYTGLKDKNGKEIFEGDIMRGIFYENEPGIGMVEWFESGARFSIFGYPMNIDGLHDIEIIGNIYENPKLMEEK